MSREQVGIEIIAKDLATGEMRRIGAATGQLAADIEGAGAKATGFGTSFRSMAQGALIGVGVAAFDMAKDALGGLVEGVIGGATDMAENLSKVRVVFGDTSGEIESFASGAARNLGMSESAALGAAGTFGNLFTAMKVGRPETVEMSKGVLQLAADLGSFNNEDPTVVLDALRAGLVGETEPLRRFGINLSAARIEAKAMEMGLVDASGSVTTAGKAQAAYALIVEDSALAQGDFARTSTGLANSQRIASATLADGLANIGSKIIPLIATLMPGLIAVVGLVTDGFGALLDIIGTEGLAMLLGTLGVAVAIAVVPPFLAWAAATLAATWPLLALGGAVTVLIVALSNLGPHIAGIADFVRGAFNGLLQVVGDVIGGVIGFVKDLVGLLAGFPNPLQGMAIEMRASLEGMERDFKGWGEGARDSSGVVADAAAGGATAVQQASVITHTASERMANSYRSVPTAAQQAATMTHTASERMVSNLVDAAARAEEQASLRAWSRGIQADLNKTIADSARAGRQMPGELSQGIRQGFDGIRSAFDDLKQLMKDALSPAKKIAELEGILTSRKLAQGLNDPRPEVRNAAQQVYLDATGELAKLRPKSEALGTAGSRAFGGAIGDEKFFVAGEAQRLVLGAVGPGGVGGIKGEMSQYGRDGGRGFGTSVGSQTGPASAGARDIRAAALSVLQGALGLFTNWGNQAGQNYASGISAKEGAVSGAARGLANAAGRQMQLRSPAKEGPLSEGGGPEGWGERFSMLLAAGVRRRIPEYASAIRSLADVAIPPVPLDGTAIGALGSAGGFFPSAALAATGGRGGGLVRGGDVTIVFGRDSVRSDDDIRRISRELQTDARIRGLAAPGLGLGAQVA